MERSASMLPLSCMEGERLGEASASCDPSESWGTDVGLLIHTEALFLTQLSCVHGSPKSLAYLLKKLLREKDCNISPLMSQVRQKVGLA